MKTQIPFINLQEQYNLYQNEIEEKVLEILRSGQYIMGPYVESLENNLKDFLGVQNAIACSSGTDALIVALLAAGIGQGDEVITSPFSFFATVEAILFVGARPVFVDIEPGTFNIDPSKIPSAITKNTKAIMPVSLFGQLCRLKSLKDIAQDHKLLLIEDGAQSFGATLRQKYATEYADVVCTSFYPAKPLGTYGDGGGIFTHDDAFAEKCRLFLNHGQDRTYHHKIVGLNCRMDALQAGVLDVKLKFFKQEIALRNKKANWYFKGLADLDLELPLVLPQTKSSWAQFSVLSDNRDALVAQLRERGVPVAIHYPMPMYRQPALKFMECNGKDYPVTENICQKILSLPMCAYITRESQNYIISQLKSLVLSRKAYG